MSSRQRRIPVDKIRRLAPAAVLIDLDGTLAIGGRPVDGAADLLAAFPATCAVLTNNSAQTSVQITRHLKRIGLTIAADRVFTAGGLLIDALVQERQRRRVYAVLSATMMRVARRRGVRLVEPLHADLVAVGRTPSFCYAHLAGAANAVAVGADLIAANPDGYHPHPDGRVVPETGAVVAAILLASGRATPPCFVGKPDPQMARRALDALGGMSADDAVVVGDNPLTDGKLAQAIGAQFVRVT